MRYVAEFRQITRTYYILDQHSGAMMEFGETAAMQNPTVRYALDALMKGADISPHMFDSIAQMVNPNWEGESYCVDGEAAIT